MGNIVRGSQSTGYGYGFQKINLGNSSVQAVYHGSNLIWKPLLFNGSIPNVYGIFSIRRLISNNLPCFLIRRTTTTPSVTTTFVYLLFDANNTISFDSVIYYESGATTLATTLGQFAAVTGFANPDGINVNQSIYVHTWYNQVGGTSPRQLTASLQPRLINSGTFETKNGKVAIRFISSLSNRLGLADTSMDYRNLSHYVVAAPFSATPAAAGIGSSLGFNTRWYVPQNGTTNTFVTYNTNNTHLSNANDTVNRLYSLVAGATTYTAYRNSTVIGTGSTVTATSDSISIGFTGSGSFPSHFDGYVQEAIVLKGTNNVSEIQTDIINYYGL